MDVWDAITKRRTVRAFKGEVPMPLLRRLLWAGSRAPSASNSQPWEFIIIDDRTVIDKIAEQKGALEGQRGGKRRIAIEKGLYVNSSVVAICNKKGMFGPAGAWLAAENIALAACGEGIGCVMSIFGGEYKDVVEKLLNLPDTHELTTVMCLGEPQEWPEKRTVGEDRPDNSWLHITTFGNQPG
jgi:nitroreductase